MLEPFIKNHWLRADRRAHSFSLSLVFVLLFFLSFTWWMGSSLTIRIGIDYIPKEISIPAFEIPSDLVQFTLGLPNYAFGEIFVPEKILPPDWLYPLSMACFLLAISLLAAGISYLSGTWFYGSLFGMAAGIALFEPAMLSPMGISSGWITALMVMLVLLPVFAISTWLSSWNLARRWWVLLLFYGLCLFVFFEPGLEASRQSKLLAALYLPLLLAALAFIFLNATDVLHGILILLTKGSGNAQSWLHFSVFSFFYLANFILIYLKNTGLLVLDIYYPDPFLLQVLSLIAGFWVLPAREALGNGDQFFGKGLFSLYASLAMCFLLASGIGYASACDPLTEVLEDGITLINFCMGLCFFLYVVINFADLMRHGLRVYEVLYRPRYMPVSSISVFGIAGVMIFLMNGAYFPFYQALAGRYIFFGDQARQEGKAVLAEELYRQALAMESRNQRGNISLALLYLETGAYAKAIKAAESSLDKKPAPEAILVMAQAYRAKGLSLDELICLQEGARRFPGDGQILNNAGMAFSNTIFADSARYYLNAAASGRNASAVARTNLGYLQLCQQAGAEGSPGKELMNDGGWANLNNQIVFANSARESSPAIQELRRKFSESPAELRAYFLYHALINHAIRKDSAGVSSLLELEDDSVKKYYSEAVAMAKALLQYRSGRVYDGMQGLLRLYDEASLNRTDLALLAGQLYYEQGAFAASSEYFRKAALAGQKNAWYWYAIACLDAGKKEESKEAIREAFPFLSGPDKIRISIIADGIGKLTFSEAARRSDQEKSVFIKLNWNDLKVSQIKDLIHLTGDRESSLFLWKYCFERAYRENKAGHCRLLMDYALSFRKNDKKWQEMTAGFRPVFQRMISGSYSEEKQAAALPAFIRAEMAAGRGETEKAVQLFLTALQEDPFNSRNARLSVNAIFSAGKKELAYEKALDLVRLDPFNPDFLELYAETALRNGLADFAFECLPKLEVLGGKERAAALKLKMTTELSAKGLPVPNPVNP
jgi:tetratricopeptide (TPR) repeat protein